MKFFLIFVLALFTSCSNKYGFFASGGQTTYTEEGTLTSPLSGSVIDVPKYSSTGKGLNVGISEESKWLLTKISYSQTSYSNVEYIVNTNSFSTDLEETGLRLSLALKLWIFQPFLLLASTAGEYEINGVTSNESYASAGYGLDIEVPITNSAFWFLGFSVDKAENLTNQNSLILTQTLGHQSIYSGIRFNIFDLSKGGSK